MNRSQSYPYPYLVIRASAGTGKTFRLSSQYIGLLHRDVAIDEILATTFTKKAAGEIMQRILLRLAEAVLVAEKRQELAESIHASDLTAERCEQLLMQVARNLHRLRISTLDSFFAQLARTHSLEMGLPPQWQIADEFDKSQLQDVAIDAVLQANSETVVTRLMHLVGKGNANRSVGELIRRQVRSLHEMFLASDSEAWEQVPRHKPLKFAELGELLEQLAVAPLPEDKRAIAARDKDCQHVATENWDDLLKGGLASKIHKGQTTYQRKEIPPETVTLYEQLLVHVRAVFLNQLANQNMATYELLEKFDEQLQSVKLEKQLLTFDDVKHSVNKHFGSQWSSAGGQQRMSYRMDGTIRHLLLDEFQDTSVEQWQVLDPLAKRVLGDANGSLFCVGDPKQAIYGWRGGVAEIFDVVEKLPEVQTEPLIRSYRFGPIISDCTNDVFNKLLDHPTLGNLQPAIEGWTSQFPDHEAVYSTRPGYVAIETAPLQEKSAGENSASQPEATLAFAAGRITELTEKTPDCSIGVLVRKNASVARLTYELNRRGVLASEEGGRPLTDAASVRIILSTLRWVDQPGDKTAWFHTVHSPLSVGLGMAVNASPRQRAQLAAKIRTTLATEGYGDTIRQWAESLVAHSSAREASRLRQLVELAHRYEPQASLRPGDFVRMAKQQKVSAPEAASVRVMTIHQAKGLQFDIVVLPELDDSLTRKGGGDFAMARDGTIGPIQAVCLHRNEKIREFLPKNLQQMFDDGRNNEIAEALCRLYVAITRPVHALHLIIAPSKEKETMLPKSAAGLLRAALVDNNPIEEKSTVYERGNPDWHEKLERRKGSVVPKIVPAEKSIADLAGVLPKSTPHPQWSSPSKLGHGKGGKLFDGFRTDRSEALCRGTIVHAWLESIEWIDESLDESFGNGSPGDGVLSTIARKHGANQEEIDKLLAEFHTMLASGATAHWLQSSAYQPPAELPLSASILSELSAGPLQLEVRNEQRIACQMGEHLLAGNIDRLVLVRREDKLLAADIIDFKTDAISPDDSTAVDTLAERYQPQIAAYRHAVAEMFRLSPERITARLLFLAVGETVDL